MDLRVGKTFDPGAVRIGKAESATWSNPLSATVVDDAFVLAVVCRLGGRVGWQVAAGLDEEFAQLTATKVRYGTRSAYLLASRARGPGVTCSGELRDPDHRLIKRLAEQRISRQGGVQWGLQVEGLEGYGWVVCRARQFIDVDNFSLERNRITLAQ